MIPNNEFSEQFTADFPSSDSMWHSWQQDEFADARQKWDAAHPDYRTSVRTPSGRGDGVGSETDV